MIGFRLLSVPALPGEASDPAYGTGVYGPPLTITTAGGGGVNTFSSRKRISVLLSELSTELAPGNVGMPYRIDFDVVDITPGTILRVDWVDVAPVFEQAVEAGKHYGHESMGRYNGYSSTYRFVDFEPINGGTVTINNLTVRRIYEFS